MLQLTENLLKKEPEELAKLFIKEGSITSTQIRRYYDDLLILQTKARMQDNESFKGKILPLIRMTEAKIAYSVGRKVLNKTFYDKMSVYLNRIESKEDLENFILFYQAIIAYVKYEEVMKKEDNYTNSNNKNNYRNYDSNKRDNWGGYRK